MRVLSTNAWPRSGLGRILLTTLVVVLFMVVSRHYLPSVHDSAEQVVSKYAPELHIERPRPSKVPFEEVLHDAPEKHIPTHSPSAPSPIPTSSSKLSLRGCPVIPNSDDYLISMKTGATELFAKLPEQLLTSLRCVPNYMIFSDIEQEMGDYHIYSSLEDVSDKYKYSHRDFDFYRRLLDLAAKGQDLSLMKITKQAAGSAWDLDKWKFLPITHKVFVEQPNVKWYIFLEADSYMAWTNVLELLSLYDPDEPWYLGATHFFGDVAFAHGGMGYFISNRAMRDLHRIYDGKHINEWEKRISEGCCGDVELAAILSEAGVNITGVPGLYGESITWFEWDEGRWCEPALSWHHMGSHDVEALWQFESKHLTQEVSHYVYKDLFHKLVEPHLAQTREDWDNMSRDRIMTGPSGLHPDEGRRYRLKTSIGDMDDEGRRDALRDLSDEDKELAISEGFYMKEMRWGELSESEQEDAWIDLSDVEKEAHTSLRACKAACEDWGECIQFFYMTDRCHLHRSVRLGHYMQASSGVEDDEDKEPVRMTSGWMMDRVRDLKDRVGTCKSVPEWMKEYAKNELRKHDD
ncbi:hypothetical protein LTR78_003446 [Recurvomyces mirabilis]|uniref:N-acetylgalactosaminide beta-1,3-galactosyltransferase n=1 Tax=Recurvomyces mirabilis TaxID=574656 RepID=A0AAE0WRN6_9PEZI|nr:hypothetical protein LTR78_003446 [Recurvomyces mirabilis]KAK5154520.1 hypothetical protein LTS14_006657 [Recurvomyces mirabilis]